MATAEITIIGGGPAGSAAAIAARYEGAQVHVIEKSKFPRHRVCGEFFSPEIQPALEQLKAWEQFVAARPARIRRMHLHFGRSEKSSKLAEPAWGLSRYTFDNLLFETTPGAVSDSTARKGGGLSVAQIIATGRHSSEPKGRRLFGFKAHFTGPATDAVELFFFDRSYVGINAVENNQTNVCGLAPEDQLKKFNFDFDGFLTQSPALRDRLKPLSRSMKWISTGPLHFTQASNPGVFLAGDALSFVDPFTGSGLVAAVKTGTLAGTFAARGASTAEYYEECRAMLKRPFEIAGIFRRAVRSGWADYLAGLVPGRLLFALTRPGK